MKKAWDQGWVEYRIQWHKTGCGKSEKKTSRRKMTANRPDHSRSVVPSNDETRHWSSSRQQRRGMWGLRSVPLWTYKRRHLIGQSQGKEALSLVSVTVATTFLIGWAFSQPFSERLGPKSRNIFCVLKFYSGCLELKVLNSVKSIGNC